MWGKKTISFGESESDYLLKDKMSEDNSCARLWNCRAEFKWRSLGLNHYMREAFYLSQWHWPPIVFIIYRVIVSAYTLIWILYTGVVLSDLVINGQKYPWPVWLTNWTYFMLTVHLLLSAVITILHTIGEKHECCSGHRVRRQLVSHEPPKEADLSGAETSGGVSESYGTSGQVEIILPVSLPWYMKLNWLIYNITATFCLVVTIVYFVALYPKLSEIFGAKFGPSLIDINLHGVSSLIVLFEMLINGIPVRILHMIHPLIYGVIYTVFSAIYWAVDHRNVLYPGVLDWNKPVPTIIALLVIGFVVIPVIHAIIFMLYKLKLFIYNKIYSV